MKNWQKIVFRTVLAATVMFLIFVNTACDVFELRNLLEGEDGAAWAGPVAIVPGTINLTTGNTLTFSAKGGSGVYTFSMATTIGGTVDSSAGYYTAAGIAGSEIIRVTDSLSNSADAIIIITTSAASTPDYRVAVPPAVASLPAFPVGGTGGGAFSGDFAIENIGGDGADNIAWRVYISSDNSLGLGDTLVDSATQGALLTGAVSGLINYSGTWPASGNTYFLIIELDANDDIAAANNTYPSAGIVVSGTPAPDYIINAVTSPPSALTGSAINETLTIQNQGAGNGSVAVSWEAYASAGDTTIDTGDLLVTSGAVVALDSGVTTSPAITGSWPAAAGTYYIVCRVSASDDANSLNNTAASAAVTVDVADVDYTVVSVTPAVPAAETGGAAIGETFTINNLGLDAGTATIDWEAYVSLNAFIDAGDTRVASGSTGALTGSGTTNITVNTGNWPSSGGPYYLLADVTAADDTDLNGGVNTAASAAVTITVPPAPDYEVTFAATLPRTDLVGGAIGGTPRFVIQNISANPGLQPVDWLVYASKNMVLDGTDTLIQSGSIGALGASGSTNVDFVGNWPGGTGSYYFLIAVSDADDDSSPENNTIISHAIAVADAIYVEGAEDNGDTGGAFNNSSTTGLTLTVGSTIALEGTMDAFNGYDTYQFTAGEDEGVDMVARWQTGFDDLDLYLWDESGGAVISFDGSNDVEPADPPLAIINLAASDNYYCGLRCWLANNTSGSAGMTYTVLLTGTPP